MSKVKGAAKDKKGKKGKKKGDVGLTVEERYKKTLQEITSLRAQLGSVLIINETVRPRVHSIISTSYG